MSVAFAPSTALSVLLESLTVETMLYSIWEDVSQNRAKAEVTQLWMSASDRQKANSSEYVHIISSFTVCIVCHYAWWLV